MKIDKLLFKSSLGLALLAGTCVAQATTITFTDFSTPTGLQINANASAPVTDDLGNKVLRLTPALNGQHGSAFSTDAIPLDANASFSSAFKFRMTNPHGYDGYGYGADGIAFVVQTLANNVGGGGGGLGYDGILNSVGIEFDTWNNGTIDGGSSNHVGIDLNGSVNSVARINVSPDMNNGSIWSAWVDYNGLTDLLEVRLAEGGSASRPLSSLLSYTVDLPTILGSSNAFAGFTAATGAANENHDILAWQFNSTYKPIDVIGGNVPEPTTVALLGIGLLGAIRFSRRKQS